MEKLIPISLIIFSALTFTGCKIKDDVTKSYDNVVKETNNVIDDIHEKKIRR